MLSKLDPIVLGELGDREMGDTELVTTRSYFQLSLHGGIPLGNSLALILYTYLVCLVSPSLSCIIFYYSTS